MRTPVYAALAITLALAVPAVAEPCYTTTEPRATLATGIGSPWGGSGIFYVVVDGCTFATDGCGFSIWLYEESNALDGLQRQDDFASDIANCGDGTLHDTPLF